MTRYLISFDDGAMVVPDGEWGAVGAAAHAVVAEAKRAGVFVTGGGVVQGATVVGVDGAVVEVPLPEAKAVVGGFVIVDVGSLEEAQRWAAKWAVACRCAQEVRALMDDPEM
ncbi:YciI family protein [Glycomyces artemisiae]|uniref:YCII-related domain-containing protein n=1 Tax=Glycomyces artemisiae TaxID=1076443 RepID=A0A2T0UE76_9ACTN|nr:YciI family protein [Glycomyces artemisiae]PRY56158.1 hypothetical protein B0I28_11040 [Glycomyces artemisiae]